MILRQIILVFYVLFITYSFSTSIIMVQNDDPQWYFRASMGFIIMVLCEISVKSD